uniref:glycosyltransferase family 9 protein n=1 Tax=Roseivirga sp. TaxID=1964215 RepID=UPI004048A236
KLRVLAIRNDKLGDFMLIWPALMLLKKSLPDCEVTVLVPSYTQSIAEACPWIDNVMIDPLDIASINRKNFDAVVTFFSTGRIGLQVWKGRIPLRIAPATKIAQIFYNHRIVQRRSRSEKPEYVYNMELIEAFLKIKNVDPATIEPPYWPIIDDRAEERVKLENELKLSNSRKWFFVHSGSGGSANNLSLEQYAKLVNSIDAEFSVSEKPQWIFTAGPGEESQARKLNDMVSDVDSVVYVSKKGLSDFSKSLVSADLFIAGSTGPLHVAGALDIKTVGFFPAKISSTSLRWRPCNSNRNTISFSPASSEMSMESIDVEEAAKNIFKWLSGGACEN